MVLGVLAGVPSPDDMPGKSFLLYRCSNKEEFVEHMPSFDGILAGPTRPSGRSPHSSKEGMCSANSSLFKQRYRRQLFLDMSSGSGTPV